MKLRLSLALTTIAAAVPVVVTLVWLDARMRHDAAREDLGDLVRAHLFVEGERERCEAHPESWGGVPLPPPPGALPPPPGPYHEVPASHAGEEPPVLFAYDVDLRARNPSAPAIDGPPPVDAWPGSDVDVLVSMPWRTGPCALILAHGTTNPRWIGALVPSIRVWLLPVLASLAAILLAGGFHVRRMRRLTRAVAASASNGFTTSVPIEGSDEVAELAHTFDAATHEVRRLLEEKGAREKELRDFVANTTHDVMVPLSVLKARLSAISEQHAAGERIDDAELAGAWNEAHYLGALLRNLATATKLDAGVPDRVNARVDLGALVERVIVRHRPIARQLGVELAHGLPPETVAIDGDETLLEQGLNNLVYNAIRYNRRGGHVAVTLDLDGDGFRIRVVDDGPGVPAGELEHLGERGYRLDEARQRDATGQGIGLDIASRVAEMHGLQLEFANAEEGGLQVDLRGSP